MRRSHCEEVEGKWEQATSQNGGSLKAHCEGWKKYREAKGEGDREAGTEGRKKETKRSHCVSGAYTLGDQVARRVLYRVVVEVATVMLVIVVVSTGSGLLPTLESLLCLFVSSIRSCSSRLSSTRSAHSSLLHPFLFLLFTSHSLYLLCFFLLQLWHSPVLPSFLPAFPSSCHFNAPSLFLSVVISLPSSFSSISWYLSEYRAQLAALPPQQDSWISRLKRSSRYGCNTPTYPSILISDGISKVKTVRCKIYPIFLSVFLLPTSPHGSISSLLIDLLSRHRTCRQRHLYELRLSCCIQIDT